MRRRIVLNNLSRSLNNQESNALKWYDYLLHAGYYLPHMIKCFFREPGRKEKKELNVLDQVQILMESNPTPENIQKCQELTQLHRIIENTKARRRLEKWSLRVIAVYLFVVLLIVMSCYTKCEEKPLLYVIKSEIPPNIMIAILTTTTANIIGLGLIVLRGHFLAKENMTEGKISLNKEEKEKDGE